MSLRIKDLIEHINEESDVCDIQAAIFKELYNIVCAKMLIQGMDKPTADYFRRCVILQGYCLLTEYNGIVYPVETSTGTSFNPLYLPTQINAVNPYLPEIDGTKTVNTDTAKSAMIYLTESDKYLQIGYGSTLYMLMRRTSWLLANVIVSINAKLLNTRVERVAVAPEDANLNTMELALKKLYSGQPYIIVKDDSLKNNLQIIPTQTAHANGLQELIESYQYIKSQFLNQIGIDSNFNMKRERLNTAEINTNDEFLKFSWDNVEKTVNSCFDIANGIFNTNYKMISPDYSDDSDSTGGDDNNAEPDSISDGGTVGG